MENGEFAGSSSIQNSEASSSGKYVKIGGGIAAIAVTSLGLLALSKRRRRRHL